MKSVGLVVEYNPFHNGHLYHLTESKKAAGADLAVAVMSGSFLQRGEPALTDKWTRTKMALQGGCDIVVELPFAYAVQHANLFAQGAVAVLDQLNVDYISFGSEDGDIDHFVRTLHTMTEHREEIDQAVRSFLSEGYSFPKACSLAYEAILPSTGVDLAKPNNILGLQYIKAVHDLNSSIKPLTILREKAGYHDLKPSDEAIASATMIRNRLVSENFTLEDIQAYVPETTFENLVQYKKTYGQWHTWEHYFPYVRQKVITSSPAELHELYEMEEGMEYRYKKGIKHSECFSSFIDYLKTKRYTRTRLQRSMVHLLMNTKKSWMKTHANALSPSYIRLLGMSTVGQEYLSSIKKQIGARMITNASKGKDPLLQKDIEAATVHHLPLINHTNHCLTREFTEKPIRYHREKGTFL
ncbi:nucleotidyltransferase [Alteribacter populi]|uniref:nucleotidyltransferase n=1 Tax=Alteribacter populi TaxID=2011011 RepID=UPI000BBB5BFB|nr:nucleotidyltransferase [Alteribacter populi]